MLSAAQCDRTSFIWIVQFRSVHIQFFVVAVVFRRRQRADFCRSKEFRSNMNECIALIHQAKWNIVCVGVLDCSLSIMTLARHQWSCHFKSACRFLKEILWISPLKTIKSVYTNTGIVYLFIVNIVCVFRSHYLY